MMATVTSDQIILFILLIAVFAGLIWGRWRYDVVAFVALLAALVRVAAVRFAVKSD